MNKPMQVSLHRFIPGLVAALLATGLSTPAMASGITRAINAAEQEFGGEAFEAERYREGGRGVIEVDVLSGNQIIEVVFSGDGRQVLDVDTETNQREVARVTAALEWARVSLQEAVDIAGAAIDSKRVREVELVIKGREDRNGRRIIAEVVSDGDEFDVVLNSRTGRVLRIRPD